MLIAHKLTSEALANILITLTVLYSVSQIENLAVTIRDIDMESGTYQLEHQCSRGDIDQILTWNFIETEEIMDKCFSIVSLMISIILLLDYFAVRCLIPLTLIIPSVYSLVIYM